MYKKIAIFIGIVLLILTSQQASAQVNETSEFPSIPHFQTDSENPLIINQKLIGDTVLIGNVVEVQEEVDGDLFVLANKIVINAPIKGSVRLIAAENIDVRSQIDGSLSFITNKIYISSTGDIQKDVYGIAQRFIHEGRVGRNLNLAFSPNAQITIAGKVIGNFYYSDARPDIKDNAFIEGETTKVLLKTDQVEKNQKLQAVFSHLFYALSLVLIGIFLLKTQETFLNRIYKKYKGAFSGNILWGVVVLFISPILLGILTMTVIGIPLALIYIAALISIGYISPLFPAIWLGQKIIPAGKSNKENQEQDLNNITILQILTGSLVISVLLMAPFLGGLVLLTSIVSLIGFSVKIYFKRA